MKSIHLLGCALALCSCIALASDKPATSAVYSEARFFYFENVPNNDQELGFSYSLFCDSQQAPISIQKFYSELQYPATSSKVSKNKEAVRIVNIYVRHNQSCNKVAGEKFEQKFRIPRSKQMTHVYVTADPDIEVRSIQ